MVLFDFRLSLARTNLCRGGVPLILIGLEHLARVSPASLRKKIAGVWFGAAFLTIHIENYKQCEGLPPREGRGSHPHEGPPSHGTQRRVLR